MSAGLPVVAAAALVGLWLALFFLGATVGGLIHLMPVVAVALVVKSVRRDGASATREESR
jgi:hypothetical protein